MRLNNRQYTIRNHSNAITGHFITVGVSNTWCQQVLFLANNTGRLIDVSVNDWTITPLSDQRP